MTKFLRNLFMTVMAVCCFVSYASITEAASIALLPLVTNIERAEEARTTYLANAIQCVKQSEGFTLVDNDLVTAAVDKNFTDGELPTPAQMKAIANEAGVDMVVIMQLDVLDSREIYGMMEEIRKNGLQNKKILFWMTGGPLNAIN